MKQRNVLKEIEIYRMLRNFLTFFFLQNQYLRNKTLICVSIGICADELNGFYVDFACRMFCRNKKKQKSEEK